MTTLPPDGNNEGQPEGQTPPPAAPPVPPAAPQQPQPGYQAPPQQPQPGYQAPPQGGYQQPAGGQVPPQGGQPQASDPASTITLNYWLSVFFTWIPALIFFLIERDKGNQASFAFHRENLNFSLLRTAVVVATYIIMIIPYIGWIIGILLWIGSIVLFVFHIIAAAKATDEYRSGRGPKFVFNIPFIK
ncbi:MAG: DUF4870 domain-containing protein [Leucobacter sp.]